MRVAIAILFFAGCGFPPPCQQGTCESLAPGAELAAMERAADVARAFYGTRAERPAIVAFAQGDCSAYVPDSSTGTRAVPRGRILLPNGRCVYGTWYPWANTVYLTTIDWRRTIAHELLHQFLDERDGDADEEHALPEWRTWESAAVAQIEADEQ